MDASTVIRGERSTPVGMERFKVKGPGNTSGGYGEFFAGLVMSVIGAYLILSNVTVQTDFWFMYRGHNLMGPMFCVVLLGVFFLFFDSKSWVGWLLFVGAGAAMFVALVSNLQFYWRQSSALSAIIMFGTFVGGLGLMLGSLREHETHRGGTS